MKNWLVIFVAMAIAITMAIPAFAGKCYTAEELRAWEAKLNERDRTAEAEYKSNGKFYHSTVEFDRKFREGANAEQADIDRQRAELEAAWQQYYAAQASQPPVYAAPVVPVIPAPVPMGWGFGYYQYWDNERGDYVNARIWCPRGWNAPAGYDSIGFDRWRSGRHFVEGRVNGSRLSINRSWPANPRMRRGDNLLHSDRSMRPGTRLSHTQGLQRLQPRGQQNVARSYVTRPQNNGAQPQQGGWHR